jgi:hypothetical protein
MAHSGNTIKAKAISIRGCIIFDDRGWHLLSLAPGHALVIVGKIIAPITPISAAGDTTTHGIVPQFVGAPLILVCIVLPDLLSHFGAVLRGDGLQLGPRRGFVATVYFVGHPMQLSPILSGLVGVDLSP